MHTKTACVALILGLTAGCRSPLFQTTPAVDLDALGQCRFDAGHNITVRRFPKQADPHAIAAEALRTRNAITRWLGTPGQALPVEIWVFAPDEIDVKRLLGRSKEKEYMGLTRVATNGTVQIAVVGRQNERRTATILRHEMAHYVLRNYVTAPPFWLNEGIATLFETTETEEGKPGANPQRLALVRYLIKTRGGLDLNTVLEPDQPAFSNGNAYARSWAVLFYLYYRQPDLVPQRLHQGLPRLWSNRTERQRLEHEIELFFRQY